MFFPLPSCSPCLLHSEPVNAKTSLRPKRKTILDLRESCITSIPPPTCFFSSATHPTARKTLCRCTKTLRREQLIRVFHKGLQEVGVSRRVCVGHRGRAYCWKDKTAFLANSHGCCCNTSQVFCRGSGWHFRPAALWSSSALEGITSGMLLVFLNPRKQERGGRSQSSKQRGRWRNNCSSQLGDCNWKEFGF